MSLEGIIVHATPAPESLDFEWVHATLIPFLLHVFGPLSPRNESWEVHVQNAIAWADRHPTPPTPNEPLLFERLMLATTQRDHSYDEQIHPYTEPLPLTRYLVRRAMIEGPFELLRWQGIGSKAWLDDMAIRYPYTREGAVDVGHPTPTREILGEEILREGGEEEGEGEGEGEEDRGGVIVMEGGPEYVLRWLEGMEDGGRWWRG